MLDDMKDIMTAAYYGTSMKDVRSRRAADGTERGGHPGGHPRVLTQRSTPGRAGGRPHPVAGSLRGPGHRRARPPPHRARPTPGAHWAPGSLAPSPPGGPMSARHSRQRPAAALLAAALACSPPPARRLLRGTPSTGTRSVRRSSTASTRPRIGRRHHHDGRGRRARPGHARAGQGRHRLGGRRHHPGAGAPSTRLGRRADGLDRGRRGEDGSPGRQGRR